MNKETFSFIIYMINACANKWNMLPSQVYWKLQTADCIDCYLVPHYDILHTQGTDYIVIAYLSEIKNISLEKAMNIYYRSKLADKIYRGTEGIQYLDYKVLIQILCDTEKELFATVS